MNNIHSKEDGSRGLVALSDAFSALEPDGSDGFDGFDGFDPRRGAVVLGANVASGMATMPSQFIDGGKLFSSKRPHHWSHLIVRVNQVQLLARCGDSNAVNPCKRL